MPFQERTRNHSRVTSSRLCSNTLITIFSVAAMSINSSHYNEFTPGVREMQKWLYKARIKSETK